MRSNPFLVTIALLSLLGAGLVAPVSGQGLVPAVQEDALKQAEGNVYNPWDRVLERVPFFLHHDQPFEEVAQGQDRVPLGFTDGHVSYEPSPTPVPFNQAGLYDQTMPQDKRVVLQSSVGTVEGIRVDGPAEFLLPTGGTVAPAIEDLRPNREWRLFGIEADLYVSCQSANEANAALDVGLGIDLFRMRQNEDGTISQTAVYEGFVTGTSATPYGYEAPNLFKAELRDPGLGTWTTGSGHGASFLPDDWFKVRISATTPLPGDCMLHYGSATFPSNVVLLTDTGSVSAWIEDRNGDFTEGLPSADQSSQDRRRMTLQIAHVTAWPDRNQFSVETDDDVDYLDRMWDQRLHDFPRVCIDPLCILRTDLDLYTGSDRIFYRWVELGSDGNVLYDSRVGHNDQRNTDIKPIEGSRTVTALESGVNLVSEDFLYTAELPDGPYAVDIYSPTRVFHSTPGAVVGLKGFTMELLDSAPDADNVHQVLPGEPTEFRLRLENFGAQSDNVQLSTNSPGTGWKVELSQSQVNLPASTLAPGADFTEVTVKVTPDATRVAGTSTTFTVTARSEFPLEVPEKTLTLTTQVVSQKAAAVDLSAHQLSIEVEPGKPFSRGLFRAHNLGGAADAFIVQPQLPTNLQGWGASASPPGRSIPADSLADFGLVLNVPQDAVPGSTFQLPVSISRVGDPTVVDTVVLTVEVLLRHGMEFSVPDSLVSIRDPEEDCPDAPRTTADHADRCNYDDADADRSTLFRLSLHNSGTVAETYTLKGDWENGMVTGATRSAIGSDPDANSEGCGGSKHPNDLWRLDYVKSPTDGELDDTARATQHGHPQVIDRVVVPPGATVYRWMEMGYTVPDNLETGVLACERLVHVSGAGFYRVVATADSEPGIKTTINLFAERHAFDAPTAHNVEMEPATDLATSTTTLERESELRSSGDDPGYSEVRHRFVVRNLGSERDDLRVNAPPVDGAGYTTHLEIVEDETPATLHNCVDDGRTLPKSFNCRKMGVMDERVFDLVVRPDASNRAMELGTLLSHDISVVSRDTGITDGLRFTTRLVGEAEFTADEVIAARNAHAGQDVAMSFQVDNIGTRGDTYSIVLTSGDPDWKPRLSTDDQVFVPGQNRLDAFLKVQVPEGTATGTRKVFTVQVDSADPDLGSEVLTFVVNVVDAPDLTVQGKDGASSVLMERSDAPQEVHAEALSATGAVGEAITFRVDRAKLPGGWAVSDPVQTSALEPNAQGHAAPVTFHVTVPANAIGTSSIPLVVEACAGDQQQCKVASDFTASADIILNLQDDVGVFLSLDDPDAVTATLPGGDVVFPVKVQNGGLSPDIIELTHTEPATGWSIRYAPASVHLGPLESRVVDVIVSAPADAEQGEQSSFILFGTSNVDASEFGQLPLVASIGEFGLEWSSKDKTLSAAPDETVRFVARVTNNGTLPDSVAGVARLATEAARDAYGSQVEVTLEPREFDLDPGQAKEVTVTVRLGPSIGAGLSIPVEASFASIPDDPSTVVPAFTVKVLDYKALDVDGDGIAEYAVDRNGDKGDGYEEFLEQSGGAGVQTGPAQLVRFLSEEGRLRHTVKVTEDNQTFDRVHLRIDGDPGARNFGDGKTDLLLDHTGDGLPDLYWDPDDEHSSSLSVFKDVNADGVPDYFVDTSGSGEFNAVYDLAQGTFLKLLARDIDNDGTLDYAVDKNGNGRVDGDETILFSRDGKLIQVTKVDVDGNGELDEVFDYDGDGVPDSFVPAGKTKGVPLAVDRDLNEDGFLDWSYDANRDGRDDHYYDPAAQSGGHQIDAQAEFVRSLQQFWYVGALFILVAALFVVLVAVTRR